MQDDPQSGPRAILTIAGVIVLIVLLGGDAKRAYTNYKQDQQQEEQLQRAKDELARQLDLKRHANYEKCMKEAADYVSNETLDQKAALQLALACEQKYGKDSEARQASSVQQDDATQQSPSVNPANPYKPNSPCWQWSNEHPDDTKPCKDSDNESVASDSEFFKGIQGSKIRQAVDCYDAKTGKKIPDLYEQFGGFTTGCGPGMIAKPDERRVSEVTK